MTVSGPKHPINDPDDNELLGFVVYDSVGWQARTIFGYPIGRAASQEEAGAVIRERSRSFLRGVWQYLDDDDHGWHPCVIKSATEMQVTVTRTNALGFQEIDDSKLVVIKEPSELNLQKT